MKLSIVITYFNRRKQLLNTLHSIDIFRNDYPLEVIIVDDDSNKDNSINDLPALFSFPVKLIVLTGRIQHDPIIPFNTGFNEVTGDVVLINCAECVHMGNIIDYIFKNIGRSSYFNFSTYSIDSSLQDKFNSLNWSRKDVIKKAINIISPTHDLPDNWKDCDTGWYVNNDTHYSLLPFCAAINRSDLEILSGFDERFANGIGYSDIDFVCRVKNLYLNTSVIKDPFCVHQAHEPTVYEQNRFRLNGILLTDLENNYPKRVNLPCNKIYVR
jgi:GT2 family glycosyltransferase